MEVSFEPLQINNISTMDKSCAIEDNSIYEECSICCESFTNKSFINECLHPFCYQCIIEWTKVKAACPLCIGPVTGILHNIRSQDDYDIEKVEPPRVDVLANIDNDFIFDVDDTDTESSYGGMESMDMESDYDNSVIYENDDFDDVNYDNETGNFFDQLSNHEESDHEDTSAQSSEHEESEEEVEVEAEVEAEEEDSSSASEHEDEDEDEDEDFEDVTNRYYNVGSDSDGEEEHADDEYDCDSNEDDDNDAETENDNDNNYFDNSEEEDDDEDEEDEPENNFFDAEQDDDDDDDGNVEFNDNFTSTSDDEYYC